MPTIASLHCGVRGRYKAFWTRQWAHGDWYSWHLAGVPLLYNFVVENEVLCCELGTCVLGYAVVLYQAYFAVRYCASCFGVWEKWKLLLSFETFRRRDALLPTTCTSTFSMSFFFVSLTHASWVAEHLFTCTRRIIIKIIGDAMTRLNNETRYRLFWKTSSLQLCPVVMPCQFLYEGGHFFFALVRAVAGNCGGTLGLGLAPGR